LNRQLRRASIGNLAQQSDAVVPTRSRALEAAQ